MGVQGNRDTPTEKGTTKGHYWQTLLRRLEGGEKSRDGQNAIANQHRAGLGKDFAVGVRRFLLLFFTLGRLCEEGSYSSWDLC